VCNVAYCWLCLKKLTVLWVWRRVNLSLELVASASSPSKLCANRHGVVPQKNGIFSMFCYFYLVKKRTSLIAVITRVSPCIVFWASCICFTVCHRISITLVHITPHMTIYIYIYIYIHTHTHIHTYTGWRTKCHTIDCARNTFLLLQKHLTSGSCVSTGHQELL